MHGNTTEEKYDWVEGFPGVLQPKLVLVGRGVKRPLWEVLEENNDRMCVYFGHGFQVLSITKHLTSGTLGQVIIYLFSLV